VHEQRNIRFGVSALAHLTNSALPNSAAVRNDSPQIPILHIVDALQLGGGEIHCMRLAQALNDGRFVSHIAYFGDALGNATAKLTTLRIQKKPHRLASFRSFYSIWQISRYLRKNKIQLIHTYLYSSHLLAVIAATLARVKVIEHVHDYRYYDRKTAKAIWGIHTNHYRFVHLAGSLASKTIVLTPECLASAIAGNRRSRRSIALLPNGVPSPEKKKPKAAALRESLGGEDAKIFLTACRLTKTKNVALAIRALALARQEVDSIVLIIAGEGPEMSQLQSLSKELRVHENIRFVGPSDHVTELLAESLALLHPSLIELNSLSILEAMSCGVPPIAFGKPSGNRLLIRNMSNGILVESTNASDWAHAMLMLARDQHLARRLGDEAQTQATSSFTLAGHAAAIKAIYWSTLNAP